MRRSITVGLVVVLFVVVAARLVRLRHRPARSVGFAVLLLNEGPKAAWTDHWGNALVVHVDRGGSWGLNTQKVTPTELKRELQDRLCWRAQTVVLFEADSEIPFHEAARAIDAIHSACETKVALITPNEKKVGFDRLYLPTPKNDSIRTIPESVIPQELK